MGLMKLSHKGSIGNMDYLCINQLVKKRQQHTVLDSISMNIKQGEFVVLLGPSGCGKTTLLRSIAGLETVDQGTIFLAGDDISHKKPSERHIGMIFQQYSLFPTKTVFQNIAFGLRVRQLTKQQIKIEVEQILELMELSQVAERYPAQLSGGQQQRVALARTLIIKPKLVLFDEPLSAIDAKLRRELQLYIKQLHQQLQMTSIFVTHNQQEAMLLADIIYLMQSGKIAQYGSPKQLYYAPNNLFVAEFFGDHNLISQADCLRVFNLSIDKSYLVVSPEYITINQPQSYVSATVLDTIFLGDYEQIFVDCQGVQLKCNLSSQLGFALIKGQQISLGIEVGRCVALESP